MRLRREDENNRTSEANHQHPQHHRDIDTLVVIDREVDLISPLVTPLTYEGLIDEIIGIENGRIKIDSTLLGEDKDDPSANAPSSKKAPTTTAVPGEKVPVSLNNTDPVFAEIRDLSIEKLGSFLQDKAIKIKERYASFRDNKDASISEIHGFVKKIPMLTN
jgi:hypothetical protein